MVTIAGIGPLAYTSSKAKETGFTIGWYWFPKYHMTSVLKLSPDLNNLNNTIISSIGSFHGYQSIESQKKGLCEDFRDLLSSTIEDLEIEK